MGCVNATPAAGKPFKTSLAGSLARRGSSLLYNGNDINNNNALISLLDSTNILKLLESSAFFSGAMRPDIENLARIVKRATNLKRTRVPLPKKSSSSLSQPAATDDFLLLGGVKLTWDDVANNSNMTTTRRDVVGEEFLLKLPKLDGSVDLQRISAGESEDLSPFDLSGHSSTSGRDDHEYLMGEPLLQETESQSISSWYILDAKDLLSLARSSLTCRELVDHKLRARAAFRSNKFSLLSLLTESEWHCLSQSLDYVTLSSICSSNVKSKGEQWFFIICDGVINVETTLIPPLSTNNSSSSSLSDALPLASIIPSNSSFPAELKPPVTAVPMAYTLGPNQVFGESAILLECSQSSTNVTVVEDGVALGIRACDWNSFLLHAAGERSQKVLMEEAVFRRSLLKIKESFPQLRRSDLSQLQTIVDSVSIIHLSGLHSRQVQMRPDDVYFVKSGTVRLSRGASKSTSPPTVTLHRKGSIFGFESVLNLYKNERPIGKSTASNTRSSWCDIEETGYFQAATNSANSFSRQGSWSESQLDGAVVWRIPTQLLLSCFLLDPIFAADFELLLTATQTENLPSFHCVMNHPVAVLHFRKHLNSQHSQENLHFYLLCKYFPKTLDEILQDFQKVRLYRDRRSSGGEDDHRQSRDDLLLSNSINAEYEFHKSRILDILKEFIVDGAPSQININSLTHKTLKAYMADLSSDQSKENAVPVDDHATVFAAAVEEICSILSTDSFPRFCANEDAMQTLVSDILNSSGLSPRMSRSSPEPSLSNRSSPVKLRDVMSNVVKASPRISGRKSFFASFGSQDPLGSGEI